MINMILVITKYHIYYVTSTLTSSASFAKYMLFSVVVVPLSYQSSLFWPEYDVFWLLKVMLLSLPSLSIPSCWCCESIRSPAKMLPGTQRIIQNSTACTTNHQVDDIDLFVEGALSRAVFPDGPLSSSLPEQHLEKIAANRVESEFCVGVLERDT